VDATSNVHQLDFNKRILILKMHGANIKKRIGTSVHLTVDLDGLKKRKFGHFTENRNMIPWSSSRSSNHYTDSKLVAQDL
jgi:hypothetical protein